MEGGFSQIQSHMCTTCKSWIHLPLEYSSIVYSGAGNTHLHRLYDLQC